MSLNEGRGRCPGTARLVIRPVQAVIELGAGPDVLSRTLNAVHHANRRGPAEDFIAVALPQMRMGRNCMLPGHEIELIGSKISLMTLLGLEGIVLLKRRGMLADTEIEEADVEPGMPGAAYVRDRAGEKRTPGWIRRSQARAARRGKPVGKPVKARGNDLSILALHYDRAVVHVRAQAGKVGDAPIMVGTYGFSQASEPAVLPVIADLFQEAFDAA
ncbi:MAG: hypothetical protein OXC26_23085 [Albidovulum sp.]|nr:hypothetical protein [Albidovulum sp.]